MCGISDEEFSKWLEKVFECKEISDLIKVKLVAMGLNGRTTVCGTQNK